MLVPALIFKLPSHIASVEPQGSLHWIQIHKLRIFLLTLWFTPCLMTCAEIFYCTPNADNEMALNIDSTQLCYTEVWIGSAIFAGATFYFVGIAWPCRIYTEIVKLRRNDALTAESRYVSLFEYYRRSWAFFEAFHLLRRTLLISSVSLKYVISEEATKWAMLFINFWFWVVLEYSEPMIPFYGKMWCVTEKVNMYHILERISVFASSL